ncbi:hypothetical protein O0555_13540 [Brevibacillus laterosporus]|uniref:membrane protein n=1 Tax=Brevibacillus laterosporus TaxID=1465 RepID=UPI000376AEE8|nr:membrane protein [Brevibacillus laterosporus]ATO49998.1 hypothetical protein BrL25_13410 [Brevibacillus laterosporus DSM 25]MBG9799332.1 membrane protein [Brevibacillus laterosporus]MBG9803062.1 membrane protein [Brevibacillus laterosporus]MCR8938357.1 hypothetical protein [Brevibacillus laterosporus]MCZ0840997.1 hypothetical protein [Brevibacillus laterosporus]
MFHKALWLKEWKQSKSMIWLLPFITFICMGFSRMQNTLFLTENQVIMNVAQFKKEGAEFFYLVSNNSNYLLASFPLLLLLALTLMGSERRSLVNDFTFSMPFSRRDIYLTKWMLGASAIVISLMLNTMIDMTVILVSPFREFFILKEHLYPLLQSSLGLIAFYSFVLMIGTLSGGTMVQAMLSIIFSIFPVGIAFLINGFLQMNFGIQLNFDLFPINLILLTSPVVLVNLFGKLSSPLLIPFIHLLVTLGLGIFLYQRNRLENNGKVIMFPAIEPVFYGGAILCFALLGGLFSSTVIEKDLFTYYAGFISLGVLAAIGSYFLRNARIRM